MKRRMGIGRIYTDISFSSKFGGHFRRMGEGKRVLASERYAKV